MLALNTTLDGIGNGGLLDVSGAGAVELDFSQAQNSMYINVVW